MIYQEEAIITKSIRNNKLLQPTALYEDAKRRYTEVFEIQQELEKAMKKAPAGKIHIVKTVKRTQFYLRSDEMDRSGKYISKSDEETIKTYLQKAYNEKVYKLLSKELASLEKTLKQSDGIIDKIQKLYSDNSEEVKKYICPIDMSDEDYALRWASIPYVGKEISEQFPYYETNKKERVRSKSELNIANALTKHGIPYKYECPLQLKNGSVIHPDFTVLNKKTRKEIYWEHRGMMDDRQYASSSVIRIKELLKNGIYLGDNLIITEETSANPLGTNEIEMMIRKYFC